MTAVVAFAVLATASAANAATFVYTGGIMKVGSAGTQVYNLQECLVDMGVNSASNVDGAYGPMTKAAVMAFQASKGVAVDGIIGPVTGPLYTAACAMDMDMDEDEDMDDEDSSDKFESSNGEEADIEDVKIDKGDDDDMSNNSKDQEAFEITVELDEDGGDAQIERMDLTFEANGPDEEDLYDIIEKVTILVDGDEVASMDTDDDDDWRDNIVDEDTIRISGLDTVIEAGDEVTFVISLDIADLDEDDDLDLDIELVEVEIRYTDEAGITDTVTETDGETVTIEAKEDFELNIDENNDNPEDDETLNLSDDIDGLVLFIADVEVEEDGQDGTLEKAELDVTVTVKAGMNDTTSAITVDTDELIDELKFMIDGDEIDSDDNSETITIPGGTCDNTNSVETDKVACEAQNPGDWNDSASVSETVTFTFDLDDMDVETEDEMEVSVEADLKELDDDSEFIGATIEIDELVFDGEDEEGDDFDTSKTDDDLTFAPTYTASAGALVLEDSDVDGYTEIGSDAESAKAIFEFELTADGDEDVTLDSLTLDLNGSDTTFAASVWDASITSGIYTIRVEIKDGSDWEYVDDAGDDSVDNIIEDGDTEMFRVTVYC